MEQQVFKLPTKEDFILELRRHKARKRQWEAEMDVKLAAIEERLKQNPVNINLDVAEVI